MFKENLLDRLKDEYLPLYINHEWIRKDSDLTFKTRFQEVII